VRVAGYGDDVAGGVAGGAMVGVVLTGGLQAVCVKSASLLCRPAWPLGPVG
jgi:hypothetical protein